MNNNLTEIIFLLDRSGSMNGYEEQTIKGFNSFVESQINLGETLLTAILFDDKYEILYNGLQASSVLLTKNEYYTRGCTALLDAVGKTINDVGLRLKNTDEANRPSKVIFVITTDGLENASVEFDYSKVKQMINHQKEKYNWEFIFMGANIDVAAESQRMGIDTANAFSYEVSETNEMFRAINHMAAKSRGYDVDENGNVKKQGES